MKYIAIPLILLLLATTFSSCSILWPDHALRAQEAIGAIWASCKIYQAQNQQWPQSMSDLKMPKLDEKTQKFWTFSLRSSQNGIQYITATSTSEMPDGPGKIVLFDAKNGKFSGYGTMIPIN